MFIVPFKFWGRTINSIPTVELDYTENSYSSCFPIIVTPFKTARLTVDNLQTSTVLYKKLQLLCTTVQVKYSVSYTLLSQNNNENSSLAHKYLKAKQIIFQSVHGF